MRTRDTLAIHGGAPVRRCPFAARYLGTAVYGEEELSLVREVIVNRLPFRDYGEGTPHMVNDLEALAREYFGIP